MKRTLALAVGAAIIVGGIFATVALSQGGQVVICHVPPGNPARSTTIIVGGKAVDAHLRNHVGDHVGPCNSGGA
jgi:hypothetical protein